jgi:hypothetical protein
VKQVIVITVEETEDNPLGVLHRKSLLASIKEACAAGSTSLTINMMIERVDEQGRLNSQ